MFRCGGKRLKVKNWWRVSLELAREWGGSGRRKAFFETFM
ncbi:hypothetical protein FM102_09125 [Corynebacterium glutamicum]|nr:hypothetical protein FM102_09125 [Corynebacterium glutamicum]